MPRMGLAEHRGSVRARQGRSHRAEESSADLSAAAAAAAAAAGAARQEGLLGPAAGRLSRTGALGVGRCVACDGGLEMQTD